MTSKSLFMSRVVLLSALFTLTTQLAAAPDQRPATPVQVADVELRLLAPTIWVTGEVISRQDSRLAAEVAGRLDWVADVGTLVKQGDVLAKMDAALLQQQMLEQQAIVQREQARLDFLVQEVERLKSLVQRRNVSESQLDQTISDRAVARGDLAVAQAKLQYVEEQLRRTQLLAPYAGVVTERLLNAGEWAASGDSIMRLVDIETPEIRIQVPGYVLPYLASGQTLKVSGGNQTATATVQTIVNVGDRQSRMYELRLQMPSYPWPIGFALRVAVPTAEPKQVITVPRDALVLRRDGNAVYRINGESMAERIAVVTGVASGDYIEVLGELHAGERVVTNGGERLRPGQPVSIINPQGN